MRLIDADVLVEKVHKTRTRVLDNLEIETKVINVAHIEAAPTVDAVPVVHAEWEEFGNTIICKACGEKWSIRDDGDFVIIEAKEDLKYCPSCGAKMDKDTKVEE